MIRGRIGLLALCLCAGLVVPAAPLSAGVESPVALLAVLCPVESIPFMLQTTSGGFETGPGGDPIIPQVCGKCSINNCFIVGDSCDLGDGRRGKCARSTYACSDKAGYQCYCKATTTNEEPDPGA